MVQWLGRWPHFVRWTLTACGAVACVLALPGCATKNADAVNDANAGLVTPSDEPEVRRRARIRLELAANYFETGQTTVALDEVKQALTADPAYADAFNLRGLIYMRLNDFPQAEDSFNRALALRSGDPSLLHNYGWLLCQQRKYAQADPYFVRALANPAYTARGKTLMARGLCQSGAGQFPEAEQSLLKAYELDAANPVVGYHLAALLLRRNELPRAQFYIRRINNSDWANAESLWLGIKIERALGSSVAMKQLADQLRKRFPESREQGAYERGAFSE
ncbi:type IV pilus biogenesis/stability protein PilW [Verminephrobacter aporrectodeae]|uniref:Type IV pilus biogenesis/stability protein PilW n=1 Tax=Verminephrobacter aporrectodeae subsp. tuberculatae TaxID=1110392 RepID=A0ABT3KQC7_9BURK|nr:type IV pilus biogenesis/stability protein PilW [Verminephrobacter aporrectodeae]MCW5320518.1 type IV pilus biogenesis/stability protein PilW [Verminephrobacter aporrectodeae subsp. tuberculatae]MCW8163798.1 type IV pilus biogenesis/stability protein PilW [Verminephrobacter aporrectodeae subsp. tuberculatae]MCW8168033.1 type IV pilus biogenesis/stability protein PilW [Verminephrobacter aporrectodeae subsp. tuberculatae]MCW8176010.1 type IV pilus biogenesis/stability protein PilW [Verminephro